MIWKKPIYADRDITLWLDGMLLPHDIKDSVASAAPLDIDLLKGALILVDPVLEKRVVASVLSGLKDHADSATSMTLFQLLKAVEDYRFAGTLFDIEQTDLLLVYGATNMTRAQENNVDAVLLPRGYGDPQVTVLVGDTNILNSTRNAYGKGRTHEFRSKTS